MRSMELTLSSQPKAGFRQVSANGFPTVTMGRHYLLNAPMPLKPGIAVYFYSTNWEGKFMNLFSSLQNAEDGSFCLVKRRGVAEL